LKERRFAGEKGRIAAIMALGRHFDSRRCRFDGFFQTHKEFRQQKRVGFARFGRKSKRTPRPDGVFVVFTGFESGLCPPSNPN
jgi:hypothetical protein